MINTYQSLGYSHLADRIVAILFLFLLCRIRFGDLNLCLKPPKKVDCMWSISPIIDGLFDTRWRIKPVIYYN